MNPDPVSYRPSAYYYRQALRKAKTVGQMRALGLGLVAEYEALREWVRAQGMIPPKFKVLQIEAREKGWID